MKTIGLIELAKLLLLLWFVARGCLSVLLLLVSDGEGYGVSNPRRMSLWMCLESAFVLMLLGISGVTK